ncbi:DUF2062 domain-containing protein [Salinadaptatus halalkaliphilus]|uniref:DUF2062 domain-containing protein n=1 Tax=Salinadaptatus halalkaliphilus TaxID=2419781 RepID=A0A4S3TGN1_9EURY|nr:DUF2062 domain-containing protein [Salinadaptatus halalkaliphilus]THE63002.1 DUF2062 domain-containing protein [Salinadaptatus halalkaliphilus]
MLRDRLSRYRDRVRRKLTAAFREEHSPHEVASSFAIGVFVTAFPTGGLGIGLFFLFISLWSWISKPAIFASVAVMNPLIKPAVYLASFQVGGLFVSTPSITATTTDGSATDIAWGAIQQLLVGNVIVALVLSLAGYVTVLHMTRVHRERKRNRQGPSRLATVRNFFRRL